MNKEHIELAKQLGLLAGERGVKVAVAESCTGGGVAQAITEVPGSSAWFEYGFVTYSNAAKCRLLGVKPQLLLQYGAVSQEVVAAMAEGAKQKATAHYALAISGIAGPGGGSPTKPVGLVWFAWVGPDGLPVSAQHALSGDRHEVRSKAVTIALQELCILMQNNTV